MSVTEPKTKPQTSVHEDFVQRFTEAWADPSPERLNALLHPDVRLEQPLDGVVVGHEAAGELWSRLFAAIPDLRGEVLSWAGRGDHLFIELKLSGTLGGRPLEWVTSDRIRLEDGLVAERVAYFDPLPLILAGLRRPSAWPRLLELNLQRLRRRG
jgi:hypothetical protein